MQKTNKVTLSVVVPVYREEKGIVEFMKRVKPVLLSMTQDFEIIFAMDRSPDGTEQEIEKQIAADGRVKLLTFSRRVGQDMASLAGLKYSTGAAVILMDVDMQDPPELITEMVAKWKEGNDVVRAQRLTRDGEMLSRRIAAYLFYWVVNRISDPPIPRNTGHYCLMTRRVVDEINKMKEGHGFIRGMISLAGFNQTVIKFNRPARATGTGNYNRVFGSLTNAITGIVGFSDYPLKIFTWSGFFIAFSSFCAGILYAILKLAGMPFASGNPTIVILIFFMGGVQLLSVGILGEYIGRIYQEVKQRPKYIIDRAVGFSDDTIKS